MQLLYVVLLGILVVTVQSRPPKKTEIRNVVPVTFDVNNTLAIFDEGEDEIIKWNLERATFVLGITGAGKSTLIKFITGNDLKLIKVRGLYVFTDGNKKIGDGTFKSKTLIPEVTYDKEANLNIIDCPGFDDTKKLNDPTFDIATNYFIKKALDSMKYVRFVFVIVHSSVITGYERHGLIKLLEYICTLINDVNKFKNSISIVINKVSGEITDIEEIGYAAEFMLEAKEYIKNQVTNTSTPKELKRLNDISSLIDILTLNTTDKVYPNIGIFRKPKTGDFNNPVIQNNKKDLRQLILSKERVIYTETDSKDFSYYLSAKSKIQMQNSLFPALTERAKTKMADISNEIIIRIQENLNKIEIGPKKIEYLTLMQNSFLKYLRSQDFYSKDDVQKLIDFIKLEFQDPTLKNLIKYLQGILNQLDFFQMVSSTNINYYYLVGLNSLEPIENTLVEIFDTKITPDIIKKSLTLMENSVNEITQSLNTKYTNTKNLNTKMDFISHSQNMYENILKMDDTLDSTVSILTFVRDNIVSTNLKSSINNLIDIFREIKLFKNRETFQVNFRKYGFSKINEVVTFLTELRQTKLIEQIKTYIIDVINSIKENLMNTINSEFNSNKGIELHLQFADFHLEFLRNLTQHENRDNNFLNYILNNLKDIVKEKKLKNVLEESVQILEKYKTLWQSLNVESIIVYATDLVTQLNGMIKEKTILAAESYMSKSIDNIASEIKNQIDLKCDELGQSNELEAYLKDQQNRFYKIPLHISTLEEVQNIIVDIGKETTQVQNKKDILTIIKHVTTQGKLFKIIYENEPNYYSAFGVHKLSEITQKLSEISIWINFLKDAMDYHTNWDQINRIQDNTIFYNKYNVYQLLQVIDKSMKYPNLRTIKNVPNFVITKLNELVAYVRSSIICDEGTLTMYGSYLTTHQISKKRCPEFEKLKTINIFAYEKLYFDGNIKFNHDIQLNIISPVWYVVADATIDLFGEKGEDHKESKPKTQKNANGIHGSPGKPGKPGGNLIGIGIEFINDNRLHITSQGGKGGQGQIGGDGGDGRPPSFPLPPACTHDSWEGFAESDFNDYNYNRDYVYHCDQLQRYNMYPNTEQCNDISSQKGAHYLIAGKDGEKGYSGGDGGAGGKGGLPGKIIIYSGNKNHKIKINHLNGEKGIGNTGGEGGQGELLAPKRLLRHREKHNYAEVYPRYVWEEYTAVIPTEKSTPGIYGKDGKNEANIENPSLNTIKVAIADVIKAYYSILKKNENKIPLSDTHKNLLKELLKIK